MIIDGRGTHFDPDIVDAFIALQDDFLAISQQYADSDADLEEKARMLARLQPN